MFSLNFAFFIWGLILHAEKISVALCSIKFQMFVLCFNFRSPVSYRSRNVVHWSRTYFNLLKQQPQSKNYWAVENHCNYEICMLLSLWFRADTSDSKHFETWNVVMLRCAKHFTPYSTVVHIRLPIILL
jgi:hypothetical protein